MMICRNSKELRPLDRLIVIAAPSCCGKSEFTRKLQSGDLPDIAEQLGIDNIEEWGYRDSYYITHKSIEELSLSPVRNILLHWTIPHPTFRVAMRNLLLRLDYDKKARTDFLETANHLTLVSLYANKQTLFERVTLREIRIDELRKANSTSLLRYWRQRRGIRSLRNFYSNSTNIVKLYERWFNFGAKFSVHQRYLIDVSESATLHPQLYWNEIAESW